ncbi:hypothetical protein Dimus_034907 [Dionaea muscipula]
MMTAMPYNLQGKVVVEVSSISQISSKWKNIDLRSNKFNSSSKNTNTACCSIDSEPTSILDTRRSSSSPTSSSTLSSNGGNVSGGNSGAVGDNRPGVAASLSETNISKCPISLPEPTSGGARKDDWTAELQNLHNISDDIVSGCSAAAVGGGGGGGGGLGLGDFENMFQGGGDGALVPWIIGEAEDFTSLGGPGMMDAIATDEGTLMETLNSNLGFPGSGLNLNPNANVNLHSNLLASLPINLPIPSSLQAGVVFHQQQLDVSVENEKAHDVISPPQFLINQHQAQSQSIQSSTVLLPSLGYSQQQQFPMALGHQSVPQQKHYQLQQQQQLQEQVARELLCKAVDMIQTGNFSHVQEILARLNQQLPVAAKPLIRVALCVKEALQSLLLMGNPVTGLVPPPKCLSLVDVVHKINAYKVFSEVSPYMHFVNFTSTQVILEELEDSDAIHILDFDIGCGAKWASFIQELPLRKRRTTTRSLKITAFASFSTNHQFELALMYENLMQFANDVGVILDLQVVNFDSFDPSNSTMPNFRASNNESIAVYFPTWAASHRPYLFHPLLRFIRQQCPKIMVTMDRGCDRSDMPVSHHLLHALDSCTNLLESLDCSNVSSDDVNKIEKFFVQPTIESTILGRLYVPDKMPNRETLFASSGFSPWSFSNLSETQAYYVVKKTPPGRGGFHVDKRDASLVLSWQRRELMAASAWKC